MVHEVEPQDSLHGVNLTEVAELPDETKFTRY